MVVIRINFYPKCVILYPESWREWFGIWLRGWKRHKTLVRNDAFIKYNRSAH